jgi:hypothetical protein
MCDAGVCSAHNPPVGELPKMRSERDTALADVKHYRTLWEDCRRALEKLVDARDQLLTELEQLREHAVPVPMLLWCPGCGQRHIDEGDFAAKRHHTHACQHCGHVWRPAVVATVGVRYLPGFKDEPAASNDTPLAAASLGEIAGELRLRALGPRAQRRIDRIADELRARVELAHREGK